MKIIRRTGRLAARVFLVGCVATSVAAGCITIPPFPADTETGTESSDGPGTSGAVDTSAATDTDGAPTSATSASTVETTNLDTSAGTGTMSLCESVGDVSDVVDSYRELVTSDDRVNAYFLNEGYPWPMFNALMGGFLSTAAGCVDDEPACSMIETLFADLLLSSADYSDLGAGLEQALIATTELQASERTALVDAFTACGSDVIDDPDNDKSVYQRVGRKPTLVEIVGAPDEPDSLLWLLAQDQALGPMFQDVADSERQARCLVRMIGDANAEDGIEGPMIYGSEDDAYLDPQCSSVWETHKPQGISLDLFNLYLTRVAAAINSSQLFNEHVDDEAPAEQDALRQALVDRFRAHCEGVVENANDCDSANQSVVYESPDANGAPVGMIEKCFEIDVPETGVDLVDRVEVELALALTHVGDLVVRLFSPANEMVVLVDRPGGGDNSGTLQADYPLIFTDEGARYAQNIGDGFEPNKVVCKDEDVPPESCTFYPDPMTPILADTYKGDNAVGLWRVCVQSGGANNVFVFAANLMLDTVKFN